jgi:predicted nucleotide-binding protein
MKMRVEDVKRLLSEAGQNIAEEKRLTNNAGIQLRLVSGAVVNIYDKGTVNVQGKEKSTVDAILSISKPTGSAGRAPITSNKVFVVYGHDVNARTQLENMLRRWGLDLLLIDQLPSEGQTIIEKLENYAFDVHFAVVLATPDDEGHRTGHPDEKQYRARQNVVLELGMLLAKLGRSKVAVLIKNPSQMERPSDIQGIIYIPFSDNVEKETSVALAKEMAKQGFDIQVAKPSSDSESWLFGAISFSVRPSIGEGCHLFGSGACLDSNLLSCILLVFAGFSLPFQTVWVVVDM